MNACDVAVIGSGPAGSVAARELARSGRRVVMIDPGVACAYKVGEALPAAALPLLDSLGLRSVLENGRHLPSYGSLSAWGSPDLQPVDSVIDPNGHGWHLDRARFDQDLRDRAVAQGVLPLRSRVTQLSRDAHGHWHVRAGDDTIRAPWVIHAGGRSAALARALGATRTRDDDLVAVYAWFDVRRSLSPSGSTDTRHSVESSSDGWWYSALLPRQARVVSFHTDGATARQLMRDAGSGMHKWRASLARTRWIAPLIAGATALGPLKATEANGARLDRFAGQGWVAAGDAALSFDPLSSQGIFNALYTGMKAGRAVAQALAGNRHELERYADTLESVRAAYLMKRGLHYRAEARWRGRPFWGPQLSGAVKY